MEDGLSIPRLTTLSPSHAHTDVRHTQPLPRPRLRCYIASASCSKKYIRPTLSYTSCPSFRSSESEKQSDTRETDKIDSLSHRFPGIIRLLYKKEARAHSEERRRIMMTRRMRKRESCDRTAKRRTREDDRAARLRRPQRRRQTTSAVL